MLMTYCRDILLVEDDPNDVFLMERAIAKSKLDLHLQIVPNGEEAVSYLSGEGKYSDRNSYPIPHCIFLDLKMPFLSGFEVLEWLRSQPALTDVPVYVLTSSPEERDRGRALQLGAKGYGLKPPSPQMLIEILQPAASQQ
jgi:CheY-like chemotaxis protein